MMARIWKNKLLVITAMLLVIVILASSFIISTQTDDELDNRTASENQVETTFDQTDHNQSQTNTQTEGVALSDFPADNKLPLSEVSATLPAQIIVVREGNHLVLGGRGSHGTNLSNWMYLATETDCHNLSSGEDNYQAVAGTILDLSEYDSDQYICLRATDDGADDEDRYVYQAYFYVFQDSDADEGLSLPATLTDQALLQLLNCQEEEIDDERLINYMEKLYLCKIDNRDYGVFYGQRTTLLAEFDPHDPNQASLRQDSLRTCSIYLDRPPTEAKPVEPTVIHLASPDNPQTKLYIISSVFLSHDYEAVKALLSNHGLDFEIQPECDSVLESEVVILLNCEAVSGDGYPKVRSYQCLFRGVDYMMRVAETDIMQSIIANLPADKVAQCSRAEANIIWDLVLTSFQDTYYITNIVEGDYGDLATTDLNHDHDGMINFIRRDTNLRALTWDLINICQI